MKRIKFVRNASVALALFTLTTTTALAETDTLEDTAVTEEVVVETPTEEPAAVEEAPEVEEPEEVVDEVINEVEETPVEEIPELPEVEEELDSEEPQEEVIIEETLPEEVIKEDVEVGVKPEEAKPETETPIKSTPPRTPELAAQQSSIEANVDQWIEDGLISAEAGYYFMLQIKLAETGEEMDELFTHFYDTKIVPKRLKFEEEVKKKEDEIASWVTAGYITPDEEFFMLTLLNSLNNLDASMFDELVAQGVLTQEEADEIWAIFNSLTDEEKIEFMDVFMELFRGIIQEIIDGEDGEDGEDEDEIDISEPEEVIPLVVKPKKEKEVQLVKLSSSQSELPQTGEETNSMAAAIGLLMLSVLGTFYFKKETN